MTSVQQALPSRLMHPLQPCIDRLQKGSLLKSKLLQTLTKVLNLPSQQCRIHKVAFVLQMFQYTVCVMHSSINTATDNLQEDSVMSLPVLFLSSCQNDMAKRLLVSQGAGW